MLFKLSLKNVKKSIKDYLIYFITIVIGIIIFYIFNSLQDQNSMMFLSKDKKQIIKILVFIIDYISIFISFILGFLILYANNFLIKRRKKEIALYQILGMKNKQVSFIIIIETLIIGLFSLIIGLIIGILLSQVLSVFTAKILDVNILKYKFLISKKAINKTILYFCIMFLLIILFNIIIIFKYKLINLLYANKESDNIKIKNKYLITIIFIFSIFLVLYSYFLLSNNNILNISKQDIFKIIIFIVLGALLFFYSISNILILILKNKKNIYYKGINIFTLKQLNLNINANVIATTIISILLLLTIIILSSSLSIISVFNNNLNKNNITDFSVLNYDNNINVKKYSNHYVIYNLYISSIKLNNVINKKSINKLKKDYQNNLDLNTPISILLETDYNKLMMLYKRKTINLKNNNYLLLANSNNIIKYYETSLINNKLLLDNKCLKPYTKKVMKIQLYNYPVSSNDGVLVISDDYKNKLVLTNKILVGNYKNHNPKIENQLLNDLNNYIVYTKSKIKNSSVGIRVIFTFVGLYLGIIFIISSACLLGIKSLSLFADSKTNYTILNKIGVDSKMINKSVFIQNCIMFFLPLIVSVFNAILYLIQFNKYIKKLINVNLITNIIIINIFIILIYGTYLLITYICCKNIIKD